MIGKFFGRSIEDLYQKHDNLSMPFVKRLRFNRAAPITYEVVMINWEGQQHPWHIHGHKVDIVARGWLDPNHRWHGGFDAASFDPTVAFGELQDMQKPVPILFHGDTWTTAPHSFVVFRLTANNPGAWMMHCHMDFHLEAGMGMLWSVENEDGSYDVPHPPADFPMCGRSATFEAAVLAEHGALQMAQLRDMEMEIARLRDREQRFQCFFAVAFLGAIVTVTVVRLRKCYQRRRANATSMSSESYLSVSD